MKNKLLTLELCRMLCSALIHSHFHHACPASYQNLKEKTKKKVQIMQVDAYGFAIDSIKCIYLLRSLD